jgi:uncharacterized repeat protein (TIGR03803 family)
MKPRILAVAMLLVAGAVIGFAPAVQAQGFDTVHEFTGGADGGNPYASTLVRDSAGNFYGTTEYGGDLNCTGGLAPGCGTVFKVDFSGESVLHTFTNSPDGAWPLPGLIQDAAGNLYGTTFAGGTSTGSNGTVFKVTKAGDETVLYNFTGSPDGDSPFSVLTRDGSGNFYGTTRSGGSFGFGTVFKVSNRGKKTVLYNFSGGADGATPFAGVILDSAGNLYGTTYAGGASGVGVVFKLNPSGTETLLHTFTSGSDGANPYAGLTRDNRGNLYGTTYFGGTSGFGTIFRIDTAGHETVLYSFAGPEGANPYFGTLVLDGKGHLFGAASTGGESNVGTVFEFYLASRKLTVLHTFTGVDGANPLGGLLRDAGGRLYGTTYQGGFFNAGVVFAVVP